MIVDLSNEDFESVAITFKGVQYKLFNGDVIQNEDLVKAFPLYFTKEGEISKKEQADLDALVTHIEEIEFNDIMPEPKEILDFETDGPPIEDTAAPEIQWTNDHIVDGPLPDDLQELFEELPNKPKEVIVEKIVEVIKEVEVPVEVIKEVLVQPKKSNKTIWSTISDKASAIIDGIMSIKFITIISMLMIAASAIFFDLEGWVETYAAMPADRVIFMVVSLYVAKLSIVKLLSLKGTFKKYFSFDYLHHLMLRSVLIASLVGMIFVSSVGIYSSLAVNTMQDVKVVEMYDKKKQSIERKITDINGFVVTQTQIMLDMPKNYASSKRKIQVIIDKKNTKKYKLITELDELETTKDKSMKNNSSKSINYTADLLGMDSVELLKLINMLLTFVLEITYIALTWVFVRLDLKEQNINTTKEDN